MTATDTAPNPPGLPERSLDAPPPPPPPPPRAVAVATRTGWGQPLLVGALGLGACLLVRVHDPNQPGSYGICPFKAVTGLDCPGCGLTRGVAALLRGDVVRALDHNVFLPVVLAVIGLAYVRWVRRSLGHEVTRVMTPRWVPWAVTAVVLGFWVVRNLGGPFAFLASGAG